MQGFHLEAGNVHLISEVVFGLLNAQKWLILRPYLIKFGNMCLSIPAKIEQIEGDMALCTVGGAEYRASIQMLNLEELSVGDYVLLHTGFAIQKISKEEADETLKIFNEFEQLNVSLDEEEKQTGNRIV